MHGTRNNVFTAGVLGSSLMVLSSISGIRYASEIQAIRANLDGRASQIIETECGRIEYARTGSGYPVLVIHGNAGGFDQGLSLAQTYLSPGFQVIAPSRFGYLHSPVPAGATPALQADAYACLLDELGIEQVAVFTTSAGVTSSVQLALRHPERVSAMIFHSPNAPGKEGLVPPPKAVFKLLLASDYVWWALNTYLGSQMQSFVGVPRGFSLTPEYKADVRAALVGALPIRARAGGMIFDTYVSNPEINKYPLAEVQTPTLVISAVDDPMALHENASTLADQLPNSRLLAVPDGGHLMLGHSTEVQAEIKGFLHSQIPQLQNNP